MHLNYLRSRFLREIIGLIGIICRCAIIFLLHLIRCFTKKIHKKDSLFCEIFLIENIHLYLFKIFSY